MKTVAEANKKRRKKMMLGFTGSGSSSSAPPSTAWYIPHLGSATPTATATELGQSPTIPTVAIPTAIAVVQPCSYPTTVVGCHQATIVASRQ
jgi:hypothetical protein